MRRQLIVNATLLALALGSLVVVWATRHAPTTSSVDARKDKLLTTWNDATITRVVLRRAGRELELVRDDGVPGGFRIVKPWTEPADAATMRALLGSLELASALRPAEGVSRADVGLSPPTLEIRLEMAGSRQVIALGKAAPAPEGARYAEVTSEGQPQRPYVISKGLVAELDLPWEKFREKRLLEYGRSELAKIQIEGPEGRSRLEQRSPGTFYWQTDGGSELANPDTIERILAALSRLASEELVEPDVARSGLGSEALRVVLELKGTGQAPITVALGGTCGASSGQVFALRERAGQSARAGCVPRELSEALSVTSESLSLTRPFSARPDEVEELSITRGEAKLELARKGSAFLLRAPGTGEVPLDAGNQRLAALLGAQGRIVRKPELAALGLEPTAGSVTIQTAAADSGAGAPGAAGQSSSGTQRVVLGKPLADGTLCLKREGDGVVLCLEAEAARAFEPDATLLRSLELLSFAASDLASLSITTGQLEQRLRRAPNAGFELEKPPGFRHDGSLVTDLVQALGTLRAEHWVSARAEQRHGLDAPRTRIAIELGSGDDAKRRELAIGNPTRDGFFASLSPDPGVFVLAQGTVLELERLLLDRALCPFAPAELRRLELNAGHKQLVLERRGDAWQAPGLSAQRASELAETLGALRAELAVHVGPARADEGFAQPSLVVTYVDARDTARRLRVGSRSNQAGQSVALARLEGVDASFGLLASTATALQSF